MNSRGSFGLRRIALLDSSIVSSGSPGIGQHVPEDRVGCRKARD